MIYGDEGADRINGGAGIDEINYSPSTAAVQVDLATGTGIGGDAQGDVITGIEFIYGTAFADKLQGDASNNTFSGADGNDVLSGRAGMDVLLGYNGDDTLNGGADDDYLYGGTGRDRLTGGTGNDHYSYSSLGNSGTTAETRDLIKDFFSREMILWMFTCLMRIF